MKIIWKINKNNKNFKNISKRTIHKNKMKFIN